MVIRLIRLSDNERPSRTREAHFHGAYPYIRSALFAMRPTTSSVSCVQWHGALQQRRPRQQLRRSSPVVSTIVTPYCAASQMTYCDDFSPSRMRQFAWSLDSAGQTILLQSCDSFTGCLWGDVSSLSWLCSYTSRWVVEHLASCPMTSSLSQMLAAVSFAHLISPPVWFCALTQASVTGPSKSPDPDSGTVCRLHCVSPTWQSAS